MLPLVKFIAHWLFRILFAVEFHGVENVPERGSVIIAGNHPSYLDPVLILIPVSRTLRFMAWDQLFRIPLLGFIIRQLGAFPVDIRKGKGESAFREGVKILQADHALGIFPEGQRSDRGPMGELRTGVARLAIATNAPIVPVTIGGASRAWPKFKLLPKPAKIIVRFHPPIRLDPQLIETRGEDREYHQEVMQQVAASINRSLTPALRGNAAWERWYQQPPSHLRTFEYAPLLAAIVATIILLGRGEFSDNWIMVWLPVLGYYLYLIADLTIIKPGRLAKWLRNSMPVWMMLFWYLPLTQVMKLPQSDWKTNLVLVSITLATFFLFFYEDYFRLQKFVRGLVVVFYFSLLLMLRWPVDGGMLCAVLLYLAIFCWRFRVVFYRFVVLLILVMLIVSLMVLMKLSAALFIYSGLSVLTILYLQSFVTAAYDIRRAGTVELKKS